MSHSDDGD
jgi:hypothetical protein